MNGALQARLRLIDFLLDYYGSVARAEVMDFCGIGPAQASRDLALYLEQAPGNMWLDHATKRYLRSSFFERQFP
jgi:hypothetical protein